MAPERSGTGYSGAGRPGAERKSNDLLGFELGYCCAGSPIIDAPDDDAPDPDRWDYVLDVMFPP